MVLQITPQALRDGQCGNARIIDVRSPAEFSTGHIPAAVNIPMEQVESRMPDLGSGPVVLVCEAGRRAEVVAGWLDGGQDVAVLSGGTSAWRRAGFAVVSCAPCRWTLERQVRLTAGIIVLASTALAVTVNPAWLYLAMFVGAGLTFAGITNICGMATLLARMPWNREGKAKVARVTTSGEQCRTRA